MTLNIVFVECNRWSEEAETLVSASYFANNVGNGYIYFNDNQFFRTWIENGPFKYQTEVYNQYTNGWIVTNNIKDIKLYNFNAAAIINQSHGGTSLPIGGQGVEDAVNYALAIAEDPAHGYDWGDRDGGVDFDCSSLVAWSFHNGGGFDIPSGPNGSSPTTYYMISIYTAAGFEWIPWSDIGNESNLIRGDILLFEGDISLGTGHTAIYIGNGEIVHASMNEFGDVYGGTPGDQYGTEVLVAPYYYGYWDGVLRYTGGNSVII